MNEQDEFVKRLKKEAAQLAFDPDAATIARVTTDIRTRIGAVRRETVAGVMSRWFVPAAALFALVIGLGAAAMTTLDEPTSLFISPENVLAQEVHDGTLR